MASRVVKISGRMRRSHPYDVWKALLRLRVRDKLIGDPEKFYTVDEIAEAMFSNFGDLKPYEQDHVKMAKLDFTLLFLRLQCRIRQRYELIPTQDYGRRSLSESTLVEQRYEEYRANDPVFSFLPDKELAEQIEHSSIDRDWRTWTRR